ncbi:amidohydrolase family protein [bacterium]|nr:amidohydrolase family protein [bacterium]
MIIDAHTHVTRDGKWFGTTYNASVDNLLRQLDRSKVERSVLLPLAGTTDNQFIAQCVRQHPDRFIGFGTIRLNTWSRDIDEIIQLNLKGVKLHPRIQKETLRDWFDNGILNKLSDLSLPITVCGWPQSTAVEIPIDTIIPTEVDRIAKRLPSLKVIIAHLAGHRFWDAFFCARSNQNVYLDCSYFFSFMKGTSIERDFWKTIKKIDQKIIFGSDFPEVDIFEYFNYFKRKIEKSDIDQSKVFCSNLSELLKK